MAEISAELDQLACELIGAGIEMLEAGEPVEALVATDAEPDAASFEGDTPDGCYRAACDHVRSLGRACTRYALLYAGVVQEDEADPGQDALFVEFGERGMECAWSGYLLYRRTRRGRIEVTDPLPAGEEALLFG